MPLPNTEHPTNSNEFFSFYAQAVFDELATAGNFRFVLNARRRALKVQRAAIERSLKEIGYFHPDDDPSVWVYRQSGFEGRIPHTWLSLPVANFAEKIASAGIDMLNERCRSSKP